MRVFLCVCVCVCVCVCADASVRRKNCGGGGKGRDRCGVRSMSMPHLQTRYLALSEELLSERPGRGQRGLRQRPQSLCRAQYTAKGPPIEHAGGLRLLLLLQRSVAQHPGSVTRVSPKAIWL